MQDFPINSEYVGKYYVMNPATDDLIANAHELKEGMVVILVNPKFRVAVDSLQDLQALRGEAAYNACIYNRWGRVLNAEIPGFTKVEVVLEYSDGTKMKVTTDTWDAWYVKKDSIPKNVDSMSEFDILQNRINDLGYAIGDILDEGPKKQTALNELRALEGWVLDEAYRKEQRNKHTEIPVQNCTLIQEHNNLTGVTIIRHVLEGEQVPNKTIKISDSEQLETKYEIHFLNEEPMADWEKELLRDAKKQEIPRQFGDGLNNDHGN